MGSSRKEDQRKAKAGWEKRERRESDRGEKAREGREEGESVARGGRLELRVHGREQRCRGRRRAQLGDSAASPRVGAPLPAFYVQES